MKSYTQFLGLVTAIALSLLMAGAAGAADAGNATVAFLMPDQGSTRYEQRDYPGFAAEMKKQCAGCKVIYLNADGDISKQQQQFNSVITQGAKVIVIDPVDSAAAASLVPLAQSQGIKVIAYDRPIPTAKPDFYVSFDNKGLGKAMTASLIDHLKKRGLPTDKGGVLEINGSPTDAAAGLIRDGVHEGLATGDYKKLAEYDTPNWLASNAQQWTAGQITRFGSQIIGVTAANDGTAGGAIAAFKATGIDPMPPVSGNDATISALQLIIAGDQYNTISKPSEIVAAAAAQVAMAMLAGETPKPETTLYGTPSKLFVPVVVTAENLKAEIIDKKLNTVEQLCTGRYLEGCKKLGITD